MASSALAERWGGAWYEPQLVRSHDGLNMNQSTRKAPRTKIDPCLLWAARCQPLSAVIAEGVPAAQRRGPGEGAFADRRARRAPGPRCARGGGPRPRPTSTVPEKRRDAAVSRPAARSAVATRGTTLRGARHATSTYDRAVDAPEGRASEAESSWGARCDSQRLPEAIRVCAHWPVCAWIRNESSTC